MRVRFLPVVISLLLTAGGIVWGATFEHGPYSGAPGPDTITISWSTSALVPARIEYEPLGRYESDRAFASVVEVPISVEKPSDTNHVSLTGLQRATDYAYRVVLLDEGRETASPVGRFTTEPMPGEDVLFVVLSDTQQQLEGVNRLELVGDAISADPFPYDFVLHAGDVIETPASFYWDDWFASFDDMLLRAPFIPVLGNHEKNHRSYYQTFQLPPGAGKESKRWWALHWGDLVIVGLDTNASKPTDYFAQQDWASEHLSGPETHKFVIFHHPVFSSDAYHGTGYMYDVIYHPIFVENEVDIVFNGHSHHYEHIVRDGVTYMVVGGGGATPRQTTPEHIQGSDVSIEGHHFYVRVTTSSSGIDVETVSVATEADGTATLTPGQILDAFVLATPPVSGLPRWLLAGAAFAVVLVSAAFVLWIRTRKVRDRSKST